MRRIWSIGTAKALNGYAARKNSLSMVGNSSRSESCLKSCGCTPWLSYSSLYAGTLLYAWWRVQRRRSYCSASISSRLYSSSESSWLRSAGGAGGVQGCGTSAEEGATLWLVMVDPLDEEVVDNCILFMWIRDGSGASSKFSDELVVLIGNRDVVDTRSAIRNTTFPNGSQLCAVGW